MPSKNNQVDPTIIFFPLLTLTLVMWFLYRSLFIGFPVWFDETLGKAIFFGLPVWVYVIATGSRSVVDTFASSKLKSGLFLGMAVGGVFGFVSSIMSIWTRGAVVESAWLFSSAEFWREFALALLTGFWETLLFYSLVMTVIIKKYPNWSQLAQVVVVAMIFVLFHLPNTILRFDPQVVVGQLLLLFLFAIGQAYLFAARRNAYALVISHAIWGMVLLVHSW